MFIRLFMSYRFPTGPHKKAASRKQSNYPPYRKERKRTDL